MPYTDPMMKSGADLTASEHMQCADQFSDLALAAMQEQHVAQEVGHAR